MLSKNSQDHPVLLIKWFLIYECLKKANELIKYSIIIHENKKMSSMWPMITGRLLNSWGLIPTMRYYNSE